MGLFDIVFGCSHKRCSFPITARGAQRRSEAASVTGIYVVCLDCGKEFPYDWQAMKIIRNKTEPSGAVVIVPGSKVA